MWGLIDYFHPYKRCLLSVRVQDVAETFMKVSKILLKFSRFCKVALGCRRHAVLEYIISFSSDVRYLQFNRRRTALSLWRFILE